MYKLIHFGVVLLHCILQYFTAITSAKQRSSKEYTLRHTYALKEEKQKAKMEFKF